MLPNKEPSLCGALLLRCAEERFFVPISYWSAPDYEKHWREALLRILGSAQISCLITSMCDPRSANFIAWWPMYRVGEMTFFQNQLLFLDRLGTRFDEKNPYQFVSKRQTENQDGVKISEWHVGVSDVQRFVESWETRGTT